MKQYGVTKPKALDYLLAIVFVCIALCSIWVSVWITIFKKQVVAGQALETFVEAIKVNVYQGGWLVAVQSTIMYASFAFALFACIVGLARKKVSALAGGLAVCISAVTVAMGIGFVVTFATNEILPITVVGLVVLLLALLYATYKVVKLEIVCIFAGTKLYKSYNEEIGKNNIVEVEVEKPVKVHQTHKEEELYEVPEEEVEEEKQDFYYKNSNGYSYYKDFEEYNKQIEQMLNNEEDVQPVEEVEDEKIHKGDIDKLKQKQNNDFTFEQKLERSFQVAKDYFAELTAYAESVGFKPALTKPGETFSYKNTKYAMIDVAGQKGLKVYYKLNIADYAETPIPLKDMSKVKKYENTPMLLVVKSELALKRAKKLFDDLQKKYDVKKEQPILEDNLVQELMEQDDDFEDDDNLDIKSNHYTFEKRLKMARPEVKKRFVELKAYFESLGFKSSITKQGEIFNYKNTKYAMICVSGKNGLKIYYKLNAKDYNKSPIPVKDMKNIKKYEKIPTLFVIKSDLATKRAKKLMDDVKKQIDQTEKE